MEVLLREEVERAGERGGLAMEGGLAYECGTN